METLTKSQNLGTFGGFHVRILCNGDLQITISEEDRLALVYESNQSEYEFEYPLIEDILYPLVEDYDFSWVDSTDIDALTSAPIIGLIDGDLWGDPDNVSWETSRIWWYPDYIIKNPLEDLETLGELIFKAA